MQVIININGKTNYTTKFTAGQYEETAGSTLTTLWLAGWGRGEPLKAKTHSTPIPVNIPA